MTKWRYNLVFKNLISTFSKVIFHDKPKKSIVTKNVEIIELDAFMNNLASKTNFNKNNEVSYGILLDNKLLHTPGGNVFSCTNKKLLPYLTNEWNAVLGKLHRFRLLPITYCLSMCIDNNHDPVPKLLDFFENDTLKHLPFLQEFKIDSFPFSDFYPLSFNFLKKVSKISFEEFSTNFLSEYGRVISFPIDSSREVVNEYVKALSLLEKIVLELLSHEYKSFILASSLAKGLITTEAALRLSNIEETYQKSLSIHGVDGDNAGKLNEWLEYWQEEESKILTYTNSIKLCLTPPNQ